MKIGIVTFPGSNCDHDAHDVFSRMTGIEAVQLWHSTRDMPALDAVVLPGGFSYGDYLRAGSIARFSPIMEAVINFAWRGGLVLGICNGFQVLTEAGLLPGGLARNSGQRFICKHVHLKPASVHRPFMEGLPAERSAFHIPIAHAEGRFVADEATLDLLERQAQVLFYYADAQGRITPESNPNGSARNIAGICNEKGNVIGMMPHPERAADRALGNTDGSLILEALLRPLRKDLVS